MRDLAENLWSRAQEALRASRHVLPVSCDAAASRAYYAAFYAVSALFALRGRTFKKHSVPAIPCWSNSARLETTAIFDA